jgi:hypothetical protein
MDSLVKTYMVFPTQPGEELLSQNAFLGPRSDYAHKYMSNIPVSEIYSSLGSQLVDTLSQIHHKGYALNTFSLSGIAKYNKDGTTAYMVCDLDTAQPFTGIDKNGRAALLVDYCPPPVYVQRSGDPIIASVDASEGRDTMRGDLEMLGYFLLKLSGAILPWERRDMATGRSICDQKRVFNPLSEDGHGASKEAATAAASNLITSCHWPARALSQAEKEGKKSYFTIVFQQGFFANKAVFEQSPEAAELYHALHECLTHCGGTPTSKYSLFRPA